MLIYCLSVAIEKELKYKLSKADYQRLLRAVRPYPAKVVHQDNYYFDDPSLNLRKKKIGLRIRLINAHQAVLTLKQTLDTEKEKNLKAYKVRREFECDLPVKKARSVIKKKNGIDGLNAKPIKELKRIIPEKVRNKLRPLGKLSTQRRIVSLGNKIYLEIDRFKIFDKTFYEFEIETTTPVKVDKTVRKFLKHYNIPYRPSRTSKLKRFVKEYKKFG